MMDVPLLDIQIYRGIWGVLGELLPLRSRKWGVSWVLQSSGRYWRGKGGALGDAKLCLYVRKGVWRDASRIKNFLGFKSGQ